MIFTDGVVHMVSPSLEDNPSAEQHSETGKTREKSVMGVVLVSVHALRIPKYPIPSKLLRTL